MAETHCNALVRGQSMFLKISFGLSLADRQFEWASIPHHANYFYSCDDSVSGSSGTERSVDRLKIVRRNTEIVHYSLPAADGPRPPILLDWQHLKAFVSILNSDACLLRVPQFSRSILWRFQLRKIYHRVKTGFLSYFFHTVRLIVDFCPLGRALLAGKRPHGFA